MLTLRSYDVNLAPMHSLCVSFIFMALLWNKTHLNEYWISASGKIKLPLWCFKYINLGGSRNTLFQAIISRTSLVKSTEGKFAFLEHSEEERHILNRTSGSFFYFCFVFKSDAMLSLLLHDWLCSQTWSACHTVNNHFPSNGKV